MTNTPNKSRCSPDLMTIFVLLIDQTKQTISHQLNSTSTSTSTLPIPIPIPSVISSVSNSSSFLLSFIH